MSELNDQRIRELAAGDVPSLLVQSDGMCRDPHPARAVFPGSFNPLHDGHRGMAHVATQHLGEAPDFELSIANVDKATLPTEEVIRRVNQFVASASIWITRAATFAEKSVLFPGATFVVGSDTVSRIADCRYYGDDAGDRDAGIETLTERECRFLVFGRAVGTDFETLDSLQLPTALRSLCEGVEEADFRHDISSTKLRSGTP